MVHLLGQRRRSRPVLKRSESRKLAEPIPDPETTSAMKLDILGRCNQEVFDLLRGEPIAAFSEPHGGDKEWVVKRHPRWKAIAIILDVDQDVAEEVCRACGENPF